MKVLMITTDIDHIEPYQYVGLKEKGATIRVIVDEKARNLDAFIQHGIEYETLNFAKRKDKACIDRIGQVIDEFRPDIVHVLRKKALSNTIPALNNSSAKLIVYRGIVGNLSFFDPVSRMTFLNPRVDYIVCVAEAIRAHFLKMGFGSMRLSPNRVVTIHKGHLTEKYSEVDKADLTQYGIPDGNFVVACTAAMRPRKGVDVLVKAFSMLKTENVSLLLVGEVRDPKILKAISESNKRENIFAVGQVPQEDALKIAGSVDVITMPSTKREGLPRALIEAMAQGTPAVVTNIGGSPELVVDGECGFVVEPGKPALMAEALDKVLTPANLESFSRKAQEHINKNFHVNKTIEKTWSLYNEALSL